MLGEAPEHQGGSSSPRRTISQLLSSLCISWWQSMPGPNGGDVHDCNPFSPRPMILKGTGSSSSIRAGYLKKSTATADTSSMPAQTPTRFVSVRAPQVIATSTRRRAVKLATLGASRTSWRTTTEPMARSGSGRDASGSARCEPCHHRRGAWEHRSCVRQLRTRDVRPALAVGGRWGRVRDHTGPC